MRRSVRLKSRCQASHSHVTSMPVHLTAQDNSLDKIDTDISMENECGDDQYLEIDLQEPLNEPEHGMEMSKGTKSKEAEADDRKQYLVRLF